MCDLDGTCTCHEIPHLVEGAASAVDRTASFEPYASSVCIESIALM